MSVAIGIVFFVWLVSGLVMILPQSLKVRRPPSFGPPDFASVTLSPSQAAAAIGARSHIEQILLQQLGARMVYLVKPAGERLQLVDGRTGEIVKITAAVAETLALGKKAPAQPGSAAKLIDQHDWRYPWGPLPLYRVRTPGSRGRVSHVSVADDKVFVSDNKSRVYGLIASLHEFVPLRAILGQEASHIALWVTSIIGIFVVLSGYVLSLPRFKRSTPPAGQAG